MMTQTPGDLTMDQDDLYREETFTDRKMGSIKQLTPVKSDGSIDSGRSIQYIGQAQLLSPLGTLPLSFDIAAASLHEAIDKFPEAVDKAVKKTMEEMKELQREAASSIVIPEAGGGGMGGLPGGGKIQLG